MNPPAWLRAGLTRPVAIAATLLAAAAVAVVAVSRSGSGAFDFAAHETRTLADGESIRGWAGFDRPSYHQGDLVGYRIELLWRDNEVQPDLEAFRNIVGIYPFDRRRARFAEHRPGAGLKSFVADFTLQPVEVEAPGSIQLDTASVFYTRAADGYVTKHALRITPPPVHLGEFYPADIRAIGLRPPKARLDDARGLRTALVSLAGLGLLALAALLVWRHGRRRADTELIPAERLWRDFHALRADGAGDRAHVVACERLYTRALEALTGIPPTGFWSGRADPEAGDARLAAARAAFAAAYRQPEPTAADVARAERIVDELLGPEVEADRLEREQAGSALARLRAQPGVLAAVTVLGAAGIAAFLLAATPLAWLAPDVRAYNDAVAVLEEEGDAAAALDAFLLVADRAADERVRAAALYNAGTLLPDFRLTRLSRDQYQAFRTAIFLPGITLARLMHDLELDAEFELVTLLTELTRRHVQAEDALKGAVRLLPGDADVSRNLEIVAKLRRAIARTLAALVREADPGDSEGQMLGQTVIDLEMLMETELPDDVAREDEGKDDRAYFIMERF